MSGGARASKDGPVVLKKTSAAEQNLNKNANEELSETIDKSNEED